MVLLDSLFCKLPQVSLLHFMFCKLSASINRKWKLVLRSHEASPSPLEQAKKNFFVMFSSTMMIP